MAESESPDHPGDGRLLETLQRLLALGTVALRPTLDQASGLVAEALGADKVDVFLHDEATNSLVALGTSDTPMARQEKALGLDRLQLANGGRAAEVFQTGRCYLNGRVDQDPEELRGIKQGLGIRSTVACPFVVDGARRGVVAASSAQPDRFSERDLQFLESVAHWMGLVGHRAELCERLARDAAEQGVRLGAEQAVRALPPRQQEVAALMAEGLTNAQIAERLLLSPGTVANYADRIMRRLGFSNRAQIAAWAARQGIEPRGSGPGSQ